MVRRSVKRKKSMIDDPYRVLGVREDCSDEELKKAYREMSKKYHPDANPDSPEAAAEKFKDVQEAYRQIVDARSRGTSAYGAAYGSFENANGDYGSFGGFGGYYRQGGFGQSAQDENIPNEIRAAVNYINTGYYQEAMNSLNQLPADRRNAAWYYYAAVASSGMGNNVDAMNYAKEACDREPNNPDYQTLLRTLQSGGSWYQTRSTEFGGFNPVSHPLGWCLSMIALNLLCNPWICAGRF